MEGAFGKPVRDRMRFWKCRVYLYYPELFGDWTGAAMTWSLMGGNGVEYMDKFFVRRRARGEGTRFLQELVQAKSLIWRTDTVLAERFYGRLAGVLWLGKHGDYVYQGFHSVCIYQALGQTGLRVSDMLLELIRIPSAF